LIYLHFVVRIALLCFCHLVHLDWLRIFFTHGGLNVRKVMWRGVDWSHLLHEFSAKDNQNMKRKHKNHSKLLEMIDKEFLLNFDYSSQNVDQLPYIFLVSSKH
jgi:hypothetical protein